MSPLLQRDEDLYKTNTLNLIRLFSWSVEKNGPTQQLHILVQGLVSMAVSKLLVSNDQ